ncbi:MAG: RimK family alpha-L-glutamate ligase [Deltaproteobacteria bacterium]|nr:RimK family alpha-L-glutamate ligase [Deltaproteobacteria bacterium]
MTSPTFYYISATHDRFTDEKMRSEARALGLETVTIDPRKTRIAIDENGGARVIESGKDLFIDSDAVVYRKSILPFAWVIQKLLMDRGATAVSGKRLDSGKAGMDKLGDYILLAGRNVRVPRTITVGNLDQLAEARDDLGNRFPLILKKVSGTHGIGVFLAPTLETLKPIVEYILQGDDTAVVLLQEFVSSSEGKDIRAVVLDGEMIAAVLRDNRGRDFRANVYQGAVPGTVTLDDDQKATAVRAATALGCELAGVDLLLGRDGPIVAEVNSPCDFSFVEQTTGIPVTRRILTFLMEKHKARRNADFGIGN